MSLNNEIGREVYNNVIGNNTAQVVITIIRDNIGKGIVGIFYGEQKDIIKSGGEIMSIEGSKINPQLSWPTVRNNIERVLIGDGGNGEQTKYLELVT